jgi:hypothetical protein
MASLRAINRKAKQVAQLHVAEKGDLVGLADPSAAAGKVYHPMGCTLNFTPGLCQPVERDLFDCYLGCGWPAQVPDHLNNAPDWTDKCSSGANDWRKIDILFP